MEEARVIPPELNQSRIVLVPTKGPGHYEATRQFILRTREQHPGYYHQEIGYYDILYRVCLLTCPSSRLPMVSCIDRYVDPTERIFVLPGRSGLRMIPYCGDENMTYRAFVDNG